MSKVIVAVAAAVGLGAGVLLGWLVVGGGDVEGDTAVAIGTFVTALGTLALAGGTLYLADRTEAVVAATQGEAEATRLSSDIARQALDSQTQPFLTVGSVAEDVLNAKSAHVRNAGNGTAIVVQAAFVAPSRTRFTASIPDPVVPAGETTAIRGHGATEGEAWLTGDNFSVVALYADVSGRERGAVRLDIYKVPGREAPSPYEGPPRWRVTQVHWADSISEVIERPRLSSQRLVAQA